MVSFGKATRGKNPLALFEFGGELIVFDGRRTGNRLIQCRWVKVQESGAWAWAVRESVKCERHSFLQV
jgi:hypothetical protein